MIFAQSSFALDILPDFNLFGGKDEQGKVVWQAGEQTVQIVPIEDSARGQNQHPARVTPEELRTVLAEIKLQDKEGIFNDEIVMIPLFVPSEINVLSSALSRALERATADEDITFVVYGRHEGLVASENMVMGGRVFFKDERLNIIIGDNFRLVAGTSEQRARNLAAGCGDCPVDTRENPYKTGKRASESSMTYPLANVDGVLLQRDSGQRREDWLIIDLDKVLANVEREKNKLPPALVKDRQRARQEAAQIAVERRQMREEMARMRKEMRDMQKGGNGTSGKPDDSAGSVEQRLSTLKALHDKGLISDQEFKKKREQILGEI